MIYVGIDVASNKHDCYLINDKGEVYSSAFTISNDEEGFKKLHNSVNDFVKQLKDPKVRIGLESTGHYSNNILNYFYKAGFQVTLINPLLTNMDQKSTTVRKTKTDKVDARNICMFLDRNRYNFKSYTPLDYHKTALKSLSRERFSLVKDFSKQKIKLQRLINIVFPEYLSLFSHLFTASSINILYSYPTPEKIKRAKKSSISKLLNGKCNVTVDKIQDKTSKSIGQSTDYYAFEIKQVIETLRFYEKQIKLYNNKIKIIMDEVSKNIMSIPGIGYITGAIILSEIGDCYTIHLSSNIIWQHDKTFHDYYLKKSKEGKHHFVILGHIDKKL
ncbi:MAG: transposase, partial [Bacilli bacterium]|nr:transposase [Bacilli bacterium]